MAPCGGFSKARHNLLSGSDDWQLLIDYDNSLTVPEHICATTARPDIVIFSNASTRVLFPELTCPLEENFGAQHGHKLMKYEELRSLLAPGWSMTVLPFEVGPEDL